MATTSLIIFSVLLSLLFCLVPNTNAVTPDEHGKCPENTSPFIFHAHLKLGVTSIQVGNVHISNISKTNFGGVVVADEPITKSNKTDAKRIGSFQGMYVYSSKEDTEVLMIGTMICFDEKSSSISIQGHLNDTAPTSIIPVVGSTGKFENFKGNLRATKVAESKDSMTIKYVICQSNNKKPQN